MRATGIFVALQQKDLPALKAAAESLSVELRAGFLSLPNCYGGEEVLALARRSLPALPAVNLALDTLDALNAALKLRGIAPRYDLAEMRSGYYHTGLVFAAYAGGFANAVARGGRYDSVGEKFGRSRPATGFSLDLRELSHPRSRIRVVARASWHLPRMIRPCWFVCANCAPSARWWLPTWVSRLAKRVCDRRLVKDGGKWQLATLA